MCQECGCGLGGEVKYSDTAGGKAARAAIPPEAAHAGSADHHHHHPHHGQVDEPPSASRILSVQQSLLNRNTRLAEQNRGYFRAKNLFVLNVMSAPGSGKTTFIQKTAECLRDRLRVGVIVGDLATDNDAVRLRETGIPVVQITTGTLCHLEAEMVARAMDGLDLAALDVLIIENVGNLVCPASYDLGENARVVLLSVTEGEDKPLKYPPLFHSADVAVLTKCDLAAAAGFQRETALANLHRISHHAQVFEVSARTSQGMQDWCAWLTARRGASGK